MGPLSNFDAHNNSNKFKISRGSNMSVGSNQNPNYLRDELVVIENPILLGAKFDDLSNDVTIKDEQYLSIMCSKIVKYNNQDFKNRMLGKEAE